MCLDANRTGNAMNINIVWLNCGVFANSSVWRHVIDTKRNRKRAASKKINKKGIPVKRRGGKSSDKAGKAVSTWGFCALVDFPSEKRAGEKFYYLGRAGMKQSAHLGVGDIADEYSIGANQRWATPKEEKKYNKTTRKAVVSYGIHTKEICIIRKKKTNVRAKIKKKKRKCKTLSVSLTRHTHAGIRKFWHVRNIRRWAFRIRRWFTSERISILYALEQFSQFCRTLWKKEYVDLFVIAITIENGPKNQGKTLNQRLDLFKCLTPPIRENIILR